jgi:hypothetical protein
VRTAQTPIRHLRTIAQMRINDYVINSHNGLRAFYCVCARERAYSLRTQRKGTVMAAHGTQHRAHVAQGRTNVSYWCFDCARSHNGTTDDMREIMGERGNVGAIGFAWCAREGAYHYSTEPRATARAMMRVAPKQHKVRLRWTTNVAQPSRSVTVRTSAADAFVRAYDLQRSRLGHCVSGTHA